MSRQDAEQAQVTFRDVAASFSEEEWKLLHEKQKEFYKNVMKEIHQALILLGYQIVNTNVWFRINNKEEVCIQDNSRRVAYNNSKPKSHYTYTNPDILLRIKNEDGLLGSDWCRSQEPECSSSHSRGNSFLQPNSSFGTKDELHINSKQSRGVEDRDSSTTFTSGVAVNIKAEREEFSTCHEILGRNKDIRRYTGDALATSLFLQNNELDEETDFHDEQESDERPPGNGRLNRETCNISKIVSGKNQPYKASSDLVKDKVLQLSEKHQGSHPWQEASQEFQVEKVSQRAINFSNSEHCTLYQGIPREERPDSYECASNLRSAKRIICQQNTQQNWRLYRCSECDKSFRMKNTLLKHRRIHTGERPYHCSVCQKSFIQKHHLIGHQRRHTGERPYHCTKCTKSFPWKESLIAHQRTHAGRVHFQCTKCRTIFSQKGDLIIHQRTHVGETNIRESPKSWKLINGQVKIERNWCSASSNAEHYPTTL